jgi:hypothetical protein
MGAAVTESDTGLEWVHQVAEASDAAVVTQVAGDYEQHYHRYVRGWEYLEASSIHEEEINLVKQTYVAEDVSFGQRRQVDRSVGLLKSPDRPSNVLVLSGAVGSGRRTSSLRTLLQAGVPDKNMYSLVLDWDRPRAQQIPYTPNHGFLLDLSSYGMLPKDFYEGIVDYQRRAAEANAYLIVIATPGVWNPGTLIPIPHVEHLRPSAVKVARSCLEQWAEGRLSWLADGALLAELLVPATSPGDAARLARIIADRTDGDQERVKDEFGNWTDYLRGWFIDHSQDSDLRERALLISVALLDGSPAGIIMQAADRLFKRVGGKPLPGGALAGPDLEERLEIIQAKRVGIDAISLSAGRHGLWEAVLQHVWKQRPPLRRVLLDWASDISAPDAIAVKHLNRIAEGLTSLVAGPDGWTALQVISGWIATDSPAHRRLAVGMLESMSTHPSVGIVVRKYLYDLAKQKNISEAVAETIADVCAGALSDNYPRMALTRLRLLASRDDGRGATAVARAIRALASNAGRRTLVLDEIINWAESDEPAICRAGAAAFLALADLGGDDPIALSLAKDLDADAVTDLSSQMFIRGWIAACQHQPTADRALASLAAWLDSPKFPDRQVVDIASAVLAGRAGDAAVANLLVGRGVPTEVGRRRRTQLLQHLMSTSIRSAAVTEPRSEPSETAEISVTVPEESSETSDELA